MEPPSSDRNMNPLNPLLYPPQSSISPTLLWMPTASPTPHQPSWENNEDRGLNSRFHSARVGGSGPRNDRPAPNHGRLKVKTSEEQAERKRQEQQKKLKIYKGAVGRIFEKRASKELDSEMDELTRQILSNNPDFATLWNIRRELINEWIETRERADVEKVLKNELEFVESCFMVNPKSYGSWHQRGWAMSKMQEPDWKREVRLCTKFLQLDERNFLCWDYRRFVVKQAGIPPEEEFKFTTDKISDNFSNFSSWHYRSKLLPLVYPANVKSDAEENKNNSAAPGEISVSSDTSSSEIKPPSSTVLPKHSTDVREDIIMQELDLVQNAFFTDPNDQSAWFYHRWLLGKENQEQKINFASFSPSDGRIIICLERPARILKSHNITVTVGGSEIKVTWTSPTKSPSHSVWTSLLSNTELKSCSGAADLCIRLLSIPADVCCDEVLLRIEPTTSGSELKCAQYLRQYDGAGSLFSRDLGASAVTTLEEQLDSCKQLHELEPDNKWVLLTVLSLMRALDPKSHFNESLEYIDKLIAVDPMRKTYYQDLRSRFVMENQLEDWWKSVPASGDLTFTLKSSDLTTAYHLDRLCAARDINLSHNSLHRLFGAQALQCVRKLDLSHNKLRTCSGLENLPYLEELDLSHNELEDIVELKSLRSCPSLKVLHLAGNPVATKLNTADILTDASLNQVIQQLSAL